MCASPALCSGAQLNCLVSVGAGMPPAAARTGAPENGTFVTFVHAAPRLGTAALSIVVRGGSLFEPLAMLRYGDASPRIRFDPGGYTIEFHDGAKIGTALLAADVTAGAGTAPARTCVLSTSALGSALMRCYADDTEEWRSSDGRASVAVINLGGQCILLSADRKELAVGTARVAADGEVVLKDLLPGRCERRSMVPAG